MLVPVRFENAKLPIDFRAVHTTDLDEWGEDARGRGFQEPAARRWRQSSARRQSPCPCRRRRTKKPEVSICVLPFANMSGDPEQEYFSDGITEDIITDLGKVSALSIVSRNMAFSFKGAKGGVSEIGRQTKANYVLVGSVRKSGARVRITAQLVDAANEAQVWGERYDRDLSDIFALQDEISKAIVAALKLTLLPEEKRALEQRGHHQRPGLQALPDGAAVQRHGQRASPGDHRPAVQARGRARPDLRARPGRRWRSRSGICIAAAPVREDGQRSGQRAIRLDPRLADAHAALGAAHQGQGQYEIGLKACEAALRLDPDSYEGNRVAGMCSIALRRYRRCHPDYFEKAAAVVETEFTAASLVSQCYAAKGDQEVRTPPRSARWLASKR